VSLRSEQRLFLNGPASDKDKIIRRELMRMGIVEEKLPKQLRDTVVSRSKRGPIGAIVLRNMSGLEKSPALETVRTFEANVGGKEEIAEKLSAVSEQLTDQQRELLVLLRSSTKKSLARLIAETGVEPVSVMAMYANGCVVLGKINAAIEAHRNLPGLIKDLVRHALDKEAICKVCVGLKVVPSKAGSPKSTQVTCPQCDGTGVSLVASKHKEFAHRQLLEVTKLVNEKSGTHVQVTQQVAVTGGQKAGFFEKMLEAADGIVHPEKAKVIDAEILQSTPEGESVSSEGN